VPGQGIGGAPRQVHRAVTHRDIKLENLLVTGENLIKLCELGSATIAVHHSPNQDWSLNQRTFLEDELAPHVQGSGNAGHLVHTRLWTSRQLASKYQMYH
jgi:serine/threonine protein kinase